MKKRVFALIITLFVILNVFIFFYDLNIITGIESIRNIYFDYVFLSVAFASNVFIIFFFLTSLFLWKEHKRRWIPPLWLTSLMAIIISLVLKVLVGRQRPFIDGSVSVLQIAFYFMKTSFNTWNLSFPSLEALLVFSALPILNKEFKKFKYIWFVFACLVAFSRVYFGVHYLSDVFAGAIIGYLLGYLVVKVEDKNKLGLRIMKKLKCC